MPHSTIPCNPARGPRSPCRPEQTDWRSSPLKPPREGKSRILNLSLTRTSATPSEGALVAGWTTPLLQPANDTAHASARVQRRKSAPDFLGRLCVRPPKGRGRKSAKEVRRRFRRSWVRLGPSPPESGSLGAPECTQFLHGCVASRHGEGQIVARARRRPGGSPPL